MKTRALARLKATSISAAHQLSLENIVAQLFPKKPQRTPRGGYHVTLKFKETDRNKARAVVDKAIKAAKGLGFKSIGTCQHDINLKQSQGSSGTLTFALGNAKLDVYSGFSYNTGTTIVEITLYPTKT